MSQNVRLRKLNCVTVAHSHSAGGIFETSLFSERFYVVHSLEKTSPKQKSRKDDLDQLWIVDVLSRVPKSRKREMNGLRHSQSTEEIAAASDG